jgi:multicomponent K+:H+ antiporter subunit E
MSRWLPFPLSSAALAALWLLLNQSVEPAHLLLGALAGVGGGLLLANLKAPLHRVRRRFGTAAKLVLIVFADIVRSNLAVARIVFQPSVRGRTAGFLSIPLELRHPGGLAVLGCIVTATPGTSWARYDATRNVLTLHILDLVDEQAWVTQFKERYEKALLEIFL